MTRLLLDFPWQLDSVLDRNSDAYFVFYQFERLCETERLKPVPFIAESDYEALTLRDDPGYTGGSNLRGALQVLRKYVRQAGESVRATPAAGPNDLSDHWKVALRDELHLKEWRTPQLVVCKSRSDAWRHSIVGADRKTEAIFRCGDSPEEYRRVIAVLESYDEHLFARSDRDPWDLQRRKLPVPGAPPHQRHPCALPKPADLNRVDLENIKVKLADIHGWEIAGTYYFLPREPWIPLQIGRQPWRDGRTFPERRCPDCGKNFPVDYKNQVWCWDETHRHWDVQFQGGGYWSISHTGRLIKKKNRIKKKKKGWRC